MYDRKTSESIILQYNFLDKTEIWRYIGATRNNVAEVLAGDKDRLADGGSNEGTE